MGLSLKVNWGVVLHLVACCALLHGCSGGGLNGSTSGGGLGKVSDQFVSAGNYVPGGSWKTEQERWAEYHSRRYFYVHNETQVAMARGEAEEARRLGPALTRALRLGTFPDFLPPENGCVWETADREISFAEHHMLLGFFQIELLAMDSCAGRRNVDVGGGFFKFCSQRWVEPEKRDTLIIRDDPGPVTRSLNVLVNIYATGEKDLGYYDVIGDGVYFPATGQMHLVGCIRRGTDNVRGPRLREGFMIMANTVHKPPLNLSTFDDCAISVTVQYPPMNCRWNKDRVVNSTIRSQREKDDSLYFDPIQRSTFFSRTARFFDSRDQLHEIQIQRSLETGGRILLPVFGLLCVALQIKHSRHNEESLPFVSLTMLGIQLANHLSQTSIIRNLQIGGHVGRDRGHHFISKFYGAHMPPHRFPDEQEYYGTMMLTEHIPYQAMAMAAIFMYMWIFHKVTDMRRIRMKVRVLRKGLDTGDPPSERRVMCTTLAISILCFLALSAIEHTFVRWTLKGMPAIFPPFVPHQLINKLTGLVVILFLVPQLLMNMQWKEMQGHRSLSGWYYIGIPFLQSLPHVFIIAKHFQVLPIFSFFDPYLDSAHGIYFFPCPIWPTGVVIFSTLQVLAVHFQFSRLRIPAPFRYSLPKVDSAPQMVDNVRV